MCRLGIDSGLRGCGSNNTKVRPESLCAQDLDADIGSDFVTMTDWLSRVTVGEWVLAPWDGEVVLRGSVVCAWSR